MLASPLIASENLRSNILNIAQKDFADWSVNRDMARGSTPESLGSIKRTIRHEDISVRTGKFDIAGIAKYIHDSWSARIRLNRRTVKFQIPCRLKNDIASAAGAICLSLEGYKIL